MAEEDPIRQIQRLLEDPSNLLGRISRIQSVIGAAPPAESAAAAEALGSSDASPYHGLLQIVRDMQTQIDGQLRPLALRAIAAEAERLREQVHQERIAQEECLLQLDRTLIACADRIHESRKLCGQLTELKRRLGELGVTAEDTPHDFDPTLGPTDILHSRIEQLERQGRL